MRLPSSYKGHESGRVPSDFSILTGSKPDKTLITIACPLTFRANPSPTAFFYHKINLSSWPLTSLPKGTIISEKLWIIKLLNKCIQEISLERKNCKLRKLKLMRQLINSSKKILATQKGYRTMLN